MNSGQDKIYFLAVLALAALFRFCQADFITIDIWSASIGILTVVVFYFFVRHLFNSKIAALASFFLSVSSWHVIISKTDYQTTLSIFLAVLSFQFLWRGIKGGELINFLIAGLVSGLGLYSDKSFFAVIITEVIIFINYWFVLKTDFFGSEYNKSKKQLIRGFILTGLVILILNLPIILDVYISYNHSWINNDLGHVSDSAKLSVAVLIFLAAGFIKELLHWIKRKHGHFSSIHTFLFAWFLIEIIPEFLSGSAVSPPNLLKATGAIPIIMIFAAMGLEWLMVLISRLHKTRDPHYQFDKKIYRRESKLLMVATTTLILAAVVITEYYFLFK